ncbi:MAG: hypothetical protein GXY44_09520 [Phycisphaerales bacterium]|nr:hypothetical protein [Phycisphaerales bacterium]
MVAAKKQHTRRTRKAKPNRRRRIWVNWPDDKLLDLRLCDLAVRIERTPLHKYIQQIYKELERRNIRFRPHFWLSEDWFSPSGVPGVAIPFYLTHPRLQRLERGQMFEVEGGTRESCLRILRHEVGHAIDHAYRLHRRKRWRELFGLSSRPYPEFYRPRPYSKRYVVHLDAWYAQSHPDEDFAETFAVWLKPRAKWRKQYRNWPALKKLEYVDSLMQEIGDQTPAIRTRAHVESIREIRKPLREYYTAKKARYSLEYPNFYDPDLRRLFSDKPEHARREKAAAFLRRVRGEVRRQVSRWTGEHQYTLDQVLNAMIGRCHELKLRAVGSHKQLAMDFAILLTVQTMNFLFGGRHRIEM